MEMPTDIQHQAMGYDRTATMFSPEGHLLQVEYAEKTVRLGSVTIAIVCSDGVVVVADKRIKDKLIVSESTNKIYEIDEHIIASAAGILSDARVLIERAQLVAQQNRVTYDSAADVEIIIKEIANMKQAFTQYGGARPFGVSVLIAGISKNQPKIFVSDVTGNYFSYNAIAIGENDEKIKDVLRKENNKKLKIDEAIKLSIKILKDVQGKNFDIEKLDIGYINIKGKKFVRLKEEEIRKLK